MTQEEEIKYRTARRRVAQKKKFYNHLTTYLVMGAFFLILNMVTSFGQWWFYWPMLGWGIGLAINYFKVFGMPGSGLGSEEWEEREMEKQMRRIAPMVKAKSASPKQGQPKRAFPKQGKPLDLDDHLELKKVETRREKIPSYRKEDLV